MELPLDTTPWAREMVLLLQVGSGSLLGGLSFSSKDFPVVRQGISSSTVPNNNSLSLVVVGKFHCEKLHSFSLKFPGTFSYKEVTPSIPIPGLTVGVVVEHSCARAQTAAWQRGQAAGASLGLCLGSGCRPLEEVRSFYVSSLSFIVCKMRLVTWTSFGKWFEIYWASKYLCG